MAAESSMAGEKPPPSGGGETAPNAKAANLSGDGDDARWRPVLGLPCELVIDLPLPGLTVADFLQLRTGSVINAHWRLGHDVPVRLNGRLIGWSEFEIAGNNLAVRLTELA
jgi:flagellar motor switch/type III secretory pathway protein FliN